MSRVWRSRAGSEARTDLTRTGRGSSRIPAPSVVPARVRGPDRVPAARRLDGVTTVGVTSGASVPEDLVQGVLDWLQTRGFPPAESVHTAEESLIFALPPELRRDLRTAEAT